MIVGVVGDVEPSPIDHTVPPMAYFPLAQLPNRSLSIAIRTFADPIQRMNSYAIYRIAETLRVLFFMTLAILIFNFYPLTAVMIVMLALLNDGAILSIAYDNVHYKDQPEAWNMRMVLGIATVLGSSGSSPPSACFILASASFISTARISRH